jgi:hypothetical protein
VFSIRRPARLHGALRTNFASAGRELHEVKSKVKLKK